MAYDFNVMNYNLKTKTYHMKTIQFIKKIMLFSALTFCCTLLISSCTKSDGNGSSAGFNLSGTANGAQMVPAVTTNGSATISGTYDPYSNVITFTVSWSNFSGAPTSGALYIGAPGSGNVASIGPAWIYGNAAPSGSYIGWLTLSNDQATQLNNGNMFFMMNTPANPNGEVRGKITATR